MVTLELNCNTCNHDARLVIQWHRKQLCYIFQFRKSAKPPLTPLVPAYLHPCNSYCHCTGKEFTVNVVRFHSLLLNLQLAHHFVWQKQ